MKQMRSRAIEGSLHVASPCEEFKMKLMEGERRDVVFKFIQVCIASDLQTTCTLALQNCVAHVSERKQSGLSSNTIPSVPAVLTCCG